MLKYFTIMNTQGAVLQKGAPDQIAAGLSIFRKCFLILRNNRIEEHFFEDFSLIVINSENNYFEID